MRFSVHERALRVCVLVLLLVPGGAAGAFAASAAPAKAENLVPGPMVLPQAWPGGETLPAGLFAIMNHVSLSKSRAYKHSSPHTQRVRTPAGEMKVGLKSVDQFVDVFKIRYALTDRFEVRTATPYVEADVDIHNGDDRRQGGLGDTTLMLRYGVKTRTADSPFSLAVDLGVTLPTGEVGDQDKYLATNAFSVIAGGGFSWVDNNRRVDLDARYAAYAEGAHGIKPGDFALFHAHYAWALSRNFDIGAEAYHRLEQQREVHGKGQGDGYSETYLGPKIQIKVPELAYLMIGSAVLFPVQREYDDVRPSADPRYEFSILMAF